MDEIKYMAGAGMDACDVCDCLRLRSVEMELRKRIVQLANRRSLRASVSMFCSFDSAETALVVRSAIDNGTENERFSVVVDLFSLWSDLQRKEEAKSLFGKSFEEHGEKRLMYTLADRGEEFRVWYGFPVEFSVGHVDSCGQNLLFDVRGRQKVVEKYVRAFCEIRSLDSFEGPYGVRIYVFVRPSR